MDDVLKLKRSCGPNLTGIEEDRSEIEVGDNLRSE